jgi:hypothetical protein
MDEVIDLATDSDDSGSHPADKMIIDKAKNRNKYDSGKHAEKSSPGKGKATKKGMKRKRSPDVVSLSEGQHACAAHASYPKCWALRASSMGGRCSHPLVTKSILYGRTNAVPYDLGCRYASRVLNPKHALASLLLSRQSLYPPTSRFLEHFDLRVILTPPPPPSNTHTPPSPPLLPIQRRFVLSLESIMANGVEVGALSPCPARGRYVTCDPPPPPPLIHIDLNSERNKTLDTYADWDWDPQVRI